MLRPLDAWGVPWHPVRLEYHLVHRELPWGHIIGQSDSQLWHVIPFGGAHVYMEVKW